MPKILFNSETASAAAILSHKARLEAAIQKELATRYPADSVTPQLSAFSASRLSRVRKQLDRIDDMMLTEEDPQKLDRLASAQAKLAEQERLLDGRPLPGSRRPGREPQRRAPMSIEPVAPAPAPPTAPEPIAPTTEHLRLPGDVTP